MSDTLSESPQETRFYASRIHEFKKGSRFDIEIYRPISVLSNLRKLFEKAMYHRLYSFREKYLITHAFISITESIRQSIDDNEFGCGIFIDLKKAFDIVNHAIL